MSLQPVGILNIAGKPLGGVANIVHEQIYGGYANGRGEIALFGEVLVYRVNLKFKTVQQRPALNPSAQARYDAVGAGETFEYCGVTFKRISEEQIVEICSSGTFRATFRAT